MQLMRKRSLSIVLLTSAFLFSAWSNVIGAAFCPRYMNRVCCARSSARRLTPVIDQSSCHHHEMAGMKMDQSEKSLDMQEQPGASSDFEADADATKATSQTEDQKQLHYLKWVPVARSPLWRLRRPKSQNSPRAV